MPQPTFLNLDAAKQAAIRAAGLAEFARNGYAGASLTRLARQLGIAKGSLYQYFARKEAFYAYLVEWAADTRTEALTDARAAADKDVFKWLGRYLRARVRFDVDHPLLSDFLLSAGREGSAEVAATARGPRVHDQADLHETLARYQKKEQLSKKVDAGTAARLIATLADQLAGWVAADTNADEEVTDEAIRKEVKQVVALLKRGMG
ncbi:MAG: TetR/AcrR family transcriptional regulator [Catalinimonas sp.]